MSLTAPTCSPYALDAVYKQKGRCLPDAAIMSIAQLWNRTHRQESPVDVTTVEHAIQGLSTKLGSNVDGWIDAPFLHEAPKHRTALVRKYFKPKTPTSWRANPREWLSTVDIDNVMKQYEASSPEFKFLGVFPRNFTEVLKGSEACIAGTHVCDLQPHLGPAQAPRTPKCMGIVFNLDRHNQSGSHWVACFISIDTDPGAKMFGAYYYDSVARPPPMEVAKWMVSVKVKVDAQSPHRVFELKYNKTRRQFQNTECGIFVIHFLTRAMKNNATFDSLCRDTGYDDDMLALRKTFFRM